MEFVKSFQDISWIVQNIFVIVSANVKCNYVSASVKTLTSANIQNIFENFLLYFVLFIVTCLVDPMTRAQLVSLARGVINIQC